MQKDHVRFHHHIYIYIYFFFFLVENFVPNNFCFIFGKKKKIFFYYICGIHRDGTILSFNILLNSDTEFEGGGTYIEECSVF
eukprot:GSMAST32.ASY1.ANO1.1843.1 assembled CDS